MFAIGGHVEKHFRQTHLDGRWFRFGGIWQQWSETRVIRWPLLRLCRDVLELPAGEQAKRGGRHCAVAIFEVMRAEWRYGRRPKTLETPSRSFVSLTPHQAINNTAVGARTLNPSRPNAARSLCKNECVFSVFSSAIHTTNWTLLVFFFGIRTEYDNCHWESNDAREKNYNIFGQTVF